jgi:hypothetical protein
MDPFENRMEGVSVRVVGSAFSAETDKSGRYAVDYVPGSFSVEFSKPGYTTIELWLSIAEKTRFPAEPVVMYPIPDKPGLYYIG